MSGGYNPKVAMPNLSNNVPPLRSGGFQPPFYFGGSQVPTDLNLKPGTFSGSGMPTEKISFGKRDIVIHMPDKSTKRIVIPTIKR